MRKIREVILKTPWLTADFLTTLRFASTLPLIVLVIKEYYLAALIVFSIMSFTDMFDGYLARLKKTSQEKGVIFDALTDMIFFLPAFFILGLKFLNPAIFVLLVAIEILRGLAALIVKILRFKAKLEANVFGKIKAWFEGFGLVALLLNPFKLSQLASILFIIAIFFSVLNLILHLKRFLTKVSES